MQLVSGSDAIAMTLMGRFVLRWRETQLGTCHRCPGASSNIRICATTGTFSRGGRAVSSGIAFYRGGGGGGGFFVLFVLALLEQRLGCGKEK